MNFLNSRVAYYADRNGEDFSFPTFLPGNVTKSQDRRERLREALAGKKTSPGTVVLDTPYFDYLDEKMMEYKTADKKRFISNKMDFSAPHKTAFWRKVAPEVIKERERFIDQAVEDQARYARIQGVGISSYSDLEFLYDVEVSGDKYLFPLPIWNVSSYREDLPASNAIPTLFDYTSYLPQRVAGMNYTGASRDQVSGMKRDDLRKAVGKMGLFYGYN